MPQKRIPCNLELNLDHQSLRKYLSKCGSLLNF